MVSRKLRHLIVILEGEVRGVYTCRTDAATRIKGLGGGTEVMVVSSVEDSFHQNSHRRSPNNDY